MHTGMSTPGHYLHWGVIQISVANVIVIGIMVALFVLALVLPFPGGQPVESSRSRDDDDE